MRGMLVAEHSAVTARRRWRARRRNVPAAFRDPHACALLTAFPYAARPRPPVLRGPQLEVSVAEDRLSARLFFRSN